MVKKKDPKNSKVEFTLASIIATLLILSLFFETIYREVPNAIIILLFTFFIMIKIFHIVKNKGTIFEDYLSLFVILLLGFLRYVTMNSEVSITFIAVSIVVVLYSLGLIPTVSKLSKSRNLVSFFSSYIIFIMMIVFMFAGAYMANPTAYTVHGEPMTIDLNNAIYFSVMTFTTVGYGDIAPLGVNKLISSMQAVIGIALNIAFIGYILSSRRFEKLSSLK